MDEGSGGLVGNCPQHRHGLTGGEDEVEPRHHGPTSTRQQARRQARTVQTWTIAYAGDMALDRITVDPTRMGGVPCVRDLRVTVSMVLGQLAAGASIDEVLTDYPYLEREDVSAALEYAAAIVNEHEVPIARPA